MTAGEEMLLIQWIFKMTLPEEYRRHRLISTRRRRFYADASLYAAVYALWTAWDSLIADEVQMAVCN